RADRPGLRRGDLQESTGRSEPGPRPDAGPVQARPPRDRLSPRGRQRGDAPGRLRPGQPGLSPGPRVEAILRPRDRVPDRAGAGPPRARPALADGGRGPGLLLDPEEARGPLPARGPGLADQGRARTPGRVAPRRAVARGPGAVLGGLADLA